MLKLNRNLSLYSSLLLFMLSLNSWAHGNKYTGAHTVLEFESGKDQLSQQSKDSLKSLIHASRAHGKIDTVEVAVWSDTEFPAKNQDLSKADRELADNRADRIEKYLKDSLGISHVKSFNMAEHSNWLAKAMNTDSAELKSLFGKNENQVMSREDFNVVKENGSAGKAVVVIRKQVK